MAFSMTETPQRGPDVSKKILKDRDSPSRETAAFTNLRHTIELADPQAFWRMEHVDIVEGAAYLIEKMAGGSSEEIPEREPIVFEKAASPEEKLTRSEVGKRRLERERKAVKKLKELLMKHTHDIHAKSYKVDVLNAAASFLNSLARAKRANCKSGNHGPSSPDAEFGASPVSTRSNLSSPSSPDSGNSSSIFEESAPGNLANSSSTTEKKPGFHRPWKL